MSTPSSARAGPTSSTASSRYVNISSLRSNASSGRLPMLQTRRLPTAHSASSASSASQSTDASRRIPSRDIRDSSLVMSMSNDDDSVRKYLRDLMDDLGIDQQQGDAIMPAPPAPSNESEEIYEASLSDPVLQPLGIFRRRHLGLLISLMFASFFTSCLKRGVLPIMRTELLMENYQADAAEILVMLPWSSMFAIGFVSDCFSVFGTHRKSYIVIGWVLVIVSLFSLTIVSYAHAHGVATGGTHAAAYVNAAVFLLGLTCFGGILTVVMAEIYFVAMSKREKIKVRGEIVGTMLMVQFLFETLGQVITNYVVFRTTSLGVQPMFTLRAITSFLSLTALIPLLAAAFLFREDGELMRSYSHGAEYEPSGRIMDKIRQHFKVIWTLLMRDSTWAITKFLVLFVFFSEFAIRYAHLVLDEVCGVDITVVSTGKIIAELLFFGAVFLWRVFLINCSWRYFAVISFLGVVWVPQLLYNILVLYNVSRDVGIYMLTTSTKSFVRGTIVALQVVMAVEIAPRAAEGATMGYVMSIATVMRLLATTISNALSYVFDTQEISSRGLNLKLTLLEEVEVSHDPTKVKLPASLEKRVIMALLVCYTAKLVAIGGAAFMPHQKHHLQWLHRYGKPSPRHAVWAVTILAVSLIAAATFNTLVVTPSTSCLKTFGGKGCST